MTSTLFSLTLAVMHTPLYADQITNHFDDKLPMKTNPTCKMNLIKTCPHLFFAIFLLLVYIFLIWLFIVILLLPLTLKKKLNIFLLLLALGALLFWLSRRETTENIVFSHWNLWRWHFHFSRGFCCYFVHFSDANWTTETSDEKVRTQMN